MILVSSCLLGLACRYDGKSKSYSDVEKFLEGKQYLPVCPEQMGGLSTPRKPCEIKSKQPLQIVTEDGEDCTQAFKKGVDEVEKLICHQQIELAILKERSPSCGSEQIYDGTFTRNLISGKGILADYLSQKGIVVKNEFSIKDLL